MNTFPDQPVSTTVNPGSQTVQNNATLTASGSAVFTGFGAGAVTIIINVVDAPTGTTPTLQYTLQEVDPADEATLFGSSVASTSITAAGIETVTLPNVKGGAIKVSWAVGGGTPSFTGVYATIGQGGAADGTSVDQGNAAALAGAWPVKVTDGTNVLGTGANPVRTDPVGTTTQPVSAASLPLPSGAATSSNQTTVGAQTTKLNDGTNTAAVTGANALKVDGSATIQPISGTVTANIGTAGSLALDATLTGGTQKAIVRGGAKGSTTPADVTSTASGADHQPIDVAIYDAAGNQITSFGGGTQYTEDVAAPADPTGTAKVLVRADTPATITGTDGDWVAQRGTNYGAGFVQIVTSAGAFVDTFGGGQQYADGAARGTATGTLAMCDDGTNIQSIAGDSSGRQIMVGAAASGAAVVGNPVLTAGSDGTDVRTLRTATDGTVRVDPTGTTTQPVSAASLPLPAGAATAANQTTVGSQTTKINDGTNTAAVKAASTAAVAADPALVVAVSPNNVLPVKGSDAIGAAPTQNPVLVAGRDATGNVQVPQVDNILGQTPKQVSAAATLTTPRAAAAGLYAQVTADGTLRTSASPSPLLQDPFDGGTVDTTNRWTVTTGGAGSVTQTGGLLTVAGGTTGNGYGKIVSKATFSAIGGGFLVFAVGSTFTGTVAGTFRFLGIGTSPASPTTAAPLTDAIGFEYDTAGVLYAVIYAAGTNVYRSAALTAPGTTPHRFVVSTRPDATLFYLDDTEIPVASSSGVLPDVQLLPILMQSVVQPAGVASSPLITSFALVLLDGGASSVTLSDGTFAWRKAQIDAQGRLQTALTSATPAQSSVASSASNVTLLASNLARKGATVFNDSTQVLFLKLGVTASSTSFTVRLTSNSYYEVPFGYTGQIDGIWNSANGSARITEFT